MGRNHARIFAGLEQTNLVAVADSDPEARRAVAGQLGCRCYRSLESLLAYEEVAAISIAVPADRHRETALLALERGVACLVEKPIADTREAASAIVEAARRHVTPLMIGHIERFNPALVALERIVAAGGLGEVTSVATRRVGSAPPRDTDAGVIVDLAIHDIDICNRLLGGRPRRVSASGSRAPLSGRLDEAELLLRYPSADAVVQADWISPAVTRALRLEGTMGRAELDYLEQALVLYQQPGTVAETTADPVVALDGSVKVNVAVQRAEPLELELAHFVEVVRSETRPIIGGAEGYTALDIALEAEALCTDRTTERSPLRGLG